LITEDQPPVNTIPIEDRFLRSRIDLSFSKDGSQTFGTIVSKKLNALGKRKNIVRWQRMGQANEFTPRFDFWGLKRFVIGAGTLSIY
jgi:hypothetical protein